MERYTQTSNSRCASGRSMILDIDEALERLSNRSSPINRMHVTVKRSSTVIPQMAPDRTFGYNGVTSPISVQTYPMLQRRLSKFKPKHVSANNQALPGLQRSKTIISTPFRHCDACTIKHLRNFNKVHSGGGTRFDDVVLVQGMKRSKSDLHFGQEGLNHNANSGKGGEVFMLGTQEPRSWVAAGNKEEVMLPTAKVPKKGLIKLTALEQEIEDPAMFSRGKIEMDPPRSERRKSDQQSIIKRKDILEQLREGNRMLAEEELRRLQEEGEEETVAQLEDYTLADLQSALGFVQEDMSDAKAYTYAQIVNQIESSGKDSSAKSSKFPKLPQVTESIKQQTFQLPNLKK